MNKKFLETIKVIDGEALYIEYHQERLNGVLGSSKKYNLHRLIKPPSKGLYRCRICYDRDNIEIEYIPYTKRKVMSLRLLYDDTIIYDKKYEERSLINKLFSKKEECDDILIVKNGLLTDTSIANIALYDGKSWLTPKRPLLKGTCRARLLDENRLIERDIRVEDIKSFKKVALMNAMIDFDIIASEKIEDIIC